ncbi:MAG: helix-turn-helix transcriptional regulator [Rhizobacter sp.]|nr:helix-turn-helix transcriptional regulator [Bacteriovorax sp.]
MFASEERCDHNSLLDSAIQLFWKKGYADTSLSDLEKATGVNKSGLYSEFKDKDDIFYESLKRYHESNPLYELLKADSLGWKNIENYFKAKINCKGQKACFMAFTMREYSIIPKRVKDLMEKNSAEVFELFLENIKAAGGKNPEVKAKHLLTYATGSCLKANAERPEVLIEEMMSFIDMLK